MSYMTLTHIIPTSLFSSKITPLYIHTNITQFIYQWLLVVVILDVGNVGCLVVVWVLLNIVWLLLVSFVVEMKYRG